MTDPRAGVYAFIEALAKENPEALKQLEEHKAKLKEWGENEIRMKTEAISERERVNGELATQKTAFDTLQGEHDALKAGSTGDDKSSPRIAELENSVKAMQKAAEESQAATVLAQTEALNTRLKSEYLNNTNLSKDFAELKIAQMITAGTIKEESGVIGGLVGGVFTPMSDHIKALEVEHSTYLSSVAGGPTRVPNGDPAQPKTSAEIHSANVVKAGGSMPTSV